jgi:hypothetical protein
MWHTWEYKKQMQNFNHEAWNEETTCGIWYGCNDEKIVAPTERMWYCELVIMRWACDLVTDRCDTVKNLKVLPEKKAGISW